MSRRSNLLIVILTLRALTVVAEARAVDPDPSTPIARIAAGSCIKQDKPQPIWAAVTAFRPDVMLLLGDNIYGDSEDMAVLREKYGRLFRETGFAALSRTTPIVAVWDDHDYGANDAGREYPMKRESQQLFLDVFGIPKDSPMRTQEGIHRSIVVGPPGRRVQFIGLDTRYHRSPLTAVPKADRVHGDGPYRPTQDPDATVLGDAQWQWLAATLREPAEIRILLSSIQVASAEHHWEGWGLFPAERARLFRVIRDSHAAGVVVVSGDRHSAEISRIPAEDDALSYALYDLTASSLNQPRGKPDDGEPNRHRLGERYHRPNFGTIEIDWEGGRLTLTVRDVDGGVVREAGVSIAELAP